MRPEGWDLEWSWPGIEGLCKWDCHLRQCDNCREAFEAGATAMLEALKKKGLYGEYGEDFIIST
ncbi:hypothetical protein LCGC14_2596120, partial [marine sediment metagenome]